MKAEFFLADEVAQTEMGARLGRLFPRGVIYLEGDLGCGKTTFSRGLIHALGHQGAVKSPTYTLVEPYLLKDLCVYHFDLYRLADPEELEYIGIRDYFDDSSLCLIEWPQKGQGFLPPADLQLNFCVEKNGRLLQITALSPAGQIVLQQLTEQKTS